MQENPLAGMEPPTQAVEPLWDLFIALAPWVLGGIAASFAAWREFRSKKIDREKEAELQRIQQEQALELQHLKMTFESRQTQYLNLVEQIRVTSEENRLHLEEGRKMRHELAEARAEIVRRDAESRIELQSRDNKINELTQTIVTLNQRISYLEREVKQMEQSNALHLRQAHATGATQ